VKFIDFIVSEEGQAIIRGYGTKKYGEGLYNDSVDVKQYDHCLPEMLIRPYNSNIIPIRPKKSCYL
jgi:hypothetical protein